MWQQRFFNFTSNICVYRTQTYLGIVQPLPTCMQAAHTYFFLLLSLSCPLLLTCSASLSRHLRQSVKRQIYLHWRSISQKSQRGKDQKGQQPEPSPAHPPARSHICSPSLQHSPLTHLYPSACTFTPPYCCPIQMI